MKMEVQSQAIRAPFQPGEEMPMWQFDKRCMAAICGGVLPQWAQSRVWRRRLQGGIGHDRNYGR
jgi:hypothetical protein